MITQILAKVLPVLVMIALGRICATKGILNDDQHAGLKNIIVSMRDDLNSRKNMAVEESQRMRRVAVVGIGTMHHAALTAEFESLINLKLLDAKDIRGIYGLRGYDQVFLMKKTTDHGHTDQLKAIKVPVQSVLGSLDELKEKLTAYCVESGRAVADES